MTQMTATQPTLTARQERELAYHGEHAARRAAIIDVPVADDIIVTAARRPWNAYWSMYDHLIAAGLAGKRVLLPGCGFGEDAIRLAMLGAQVSASDLSPASVAIAQARAQAAGHGDIDFKVMPCETLAYADDYFDAVVFVDILHHVDIVATMAEVRRVLKPGALVVGNELYTHSALQRVRDSRLVAGPLYRLMRRWIYGGEVPYITEDEHKIDEHEYAIVRAAMTACDDRYFGMLEGRLFPTSLGWAARIDRRIMQMLGSAASRLGSRVVFAGTVAK